MKENSLNKRKYDLKIISSEEELSELNQNNDNKEILEYKILIIGNNLTGKTSFCQRFVNNTFDLEIKSSTETNCYLKTILLFDKEIKIYLLDIETVPVSALEEDEEYELYKDPNGIVIIYDLTQNESFENVEKLINNAKKKGKIENDVPKIIIGNKNDLKFLRNVDFSQAKEKAIKLGCELFEINCNKDEEMVHNIMKILISKIYFNSLQNEEKEKIIKNAKEFSENRK